MHNLILFLLYPLPSSLLLTPLPQSNFLHPTSGLALQYISQYSPADSVVPFPVAIPFTQDMCYLLPLHAVRKIPTCHHPTTNSSDNTASRQKRFITDSIAIGMGSAALAMSTANSIQLLKLNQEVDTITNP
ncbi:unnamed protein product [Rotaria sp. Silwood2]|nr:unnamed protein product [Rotaria sp. Silwood2]CAF3394240.1 unnamed protein product [Rotaria sp. Silwood2]CAF4364895.1 unnamed protein product [Rotaria sp. Silwood2]CAF4520348.1 unnamed protein product [Rotaria sp. Silwood2]